MGGPLLLAFKRESSGEPPHPQLPERLLRKLERLDAEQLHIVEIVVAAIIRGGL